MTISYNYHLHVIVFLSRIIQKLRFEKTPLKMFFFESFFFLYMPIFIILDILIHIYYKRQIVYAPLSVSERMTFTDLFQALEFRKFHGHNMT